MTNAEIIRELTDDELNNFLAMWEEHDIDYAVTFCDLCAYGGNTLGLDCDGCRMHWLQEDASMFLHGMESMRKEKNNGIR